MNGPSKGGVNPQMYGANMQAQSPAKGGATAQGGLSAPGDMTGGSMTSAGAGATSPLDPNVDISGAQMSAQQAPTGPNAFDTGLGAMDQSMAFFQQMMGPQQGAANLGYGGGYRPSSPSTGVSDLERIQGTTYDPVASFQGQQYQADQLANRDLSAYMNPYQDQVIDAAMNDLNRGRQMALNDTGAAATRGGAFGGDRHGIMEAQNNRDYMDQVARTSSQLRAQNYMNAQNMGMQDVGALNQQRASNAAMAQQAGLTNQAAQNAAEQYNAGVANQTAAQNAAATNAWLAQQSQQQSAESMNQARVGAQMAGIRAQQQQAQQANQMAAAQMLYGMGNDRFNMGQSALNSMGQVGSEIDAINQQLIDQQYQMFQNQQNAPLERYQSNLGALGALGGSGTQTYTPGKMDYLGMGTSLAGAAIMKSDAGLKENLKPVAKINGFQLYTWEWNEWAKEVGCDNDPTLGVIAQEVRETRPEAVVEHPDGYLMVDYGKLPELSRTVAMMRA